MLPFFSDPWLNDERFFIRDLLQVSGARETLTEEGDPFGSYRRRSGFPHSRVIRGRRSVMAVSNYDRRYIRVSSDADCCNLFLSLLVYSYKVVTN